MVTHAVMADCVQFHGMGLDDRILKAIAKLGWAHPTLIQEKAIPLAMEGKDILARAKTGSGKTAAYAIPVVQKILQAKVAGCMSAAVRALILVPSKELCAQATRNVKELSSCCSREVRVVDVSNSASIASQRTTLMEKPDIVVGTPNRVLAHLQHKNLALRDTLELLVLDEADLLFSYGYEDDLRALNSHLPSIYQAFLMSATLSEDVQSLKKLVLHNPVVLKLEESDLPAEDRLTQYHIKCNVEDKFLLIYTLLKLGLIRGKSLLFVNHIDRCYKLKLFLEQFSIKSCVLNSELPHNSRCHIVDEFNRGIYDYIIATDELPEQQLTVSGSKKSQQQPRKRKKDKEYTVARGIDFQDVENVVNFDFPPTPEAYVHRVGRVKVYLNECPPWSELRVEFEKHGLKRCVYLRTARGFEYGTALTFVCPGEEDELPMLEERLKGDGAADVIKPYRFRMSEIEGFRYRVLDALRSVTKASVKEARLKEIRAEILNSEKLKAHFEDNPRDLQVLRHDKVLQPTRVQPHLKHIPSYLVPKALQAVDTSFSATKTHWHRPRSRNRGQKRSRRDDPLRSFTCASYPSKKARKS